MGDTVSDEVWRATLRPIQSDRARRVGTALTACTVVALALYVGTHLGGSTGYVWNFGLVWKYIPVLGRAVLVTLELTAICVILSLPLGVLVAGAVMSNIPPLRWIATLYIELMRNTPLLIQLVWIFYALPIVVGIRLGGFEAGVISITLNVGSYCADAVRAGIQAVPRAQGEAAAVLGLSLIQKMRYVILPQAFRNVLPVLVFIGVIAFKDTALVAWLGVDDLMNTGNTIALTIFRPLEILTTVGIIYFLVALTATLVLRRLETRLSRHEVRRIAR